VFSHALRSGLLGAADANQDGRISYDELEAFITVSSSSQTNEAYRPHLFARAPKVNSTFLDLSHLHVGAPGLQRFPLTLDGKVTFRDGHGVRWLDINAEHGFAPVLWLPTSSGTVTSTVVRDGRALLHEQAIGPLASRDEPAARGGDEVLEGFFTQGFGPQRLARFLDDKVKEPPAVYGLTRAQEQRITLELKVWAEEWRRQRLSAASTFLPLGATFMLGGVSAVVIAPNITGNTNRAFATNFGISLGLAGALDVALGAAMAFEETAEERYLREWLADGTPPTADRLNKLLKEWTVLADNNRHAREIAPWVSGGVGLVFAAGAGVLAGFAEQQRDVGVRDALLPLAMALGSAGLGMLVGAGANALFPPPQSEVEDRLQLLTGDPDAPVVPAPAPSVPATTSNAPPLAETRTP
jgi:hypothetical protein